MAASWATSTDLRDHKFLMRHQRETHAHLRWFNQMIQTLLFDFLYTPKTPLLFAIYQIKPGDCDVEEKDKWKKKCFSESKSKFYFPAVKENTAFQSCSDLSFWLKRGNWSKINVSSRGGKMSKEALKNFQLIDYRARKLFDYFSPSASGGSWCCLYFCCIAHWFWPSPALHRHEPPNLIWFCTFRSYRRSHLFRTSPAFYLLRSSPPTYPLSSTEGLFSDHHHHGARPRPDTGQWAPLSQSTYDRL